MSATIFVRERRKVEQGEKKPRFRVVGVSGGDVKIYVKHMRKKELDQLSEATGAKVVFLKAGKEEKSGA
jgi:ethanolamine ammonia-lyase small subunit